jgi:redox-sensitive bicupin YhaK (pirin superfamily)
MIVLRRAEERGKANFGWLDARHTFSFGHYYDPRFMGCGPLRVINEDRVAPGGGFPTHPHADMEIITYILEGALEHRDSLGTGAVIRPGEVQRMSAGTGIRHSEFNASKTEPVHLLQIWIMPEREGIEPGYEQKRFDLDAAKGKLLLVASRDGAEGSVKIHQDAARRAGRLAGGQRVRESLAPGRVAWLQMARGEASLNGERLRQGDGVAIRDERELEIVAEAGAEVLLFDMAA